jgi:hypothetical protein
MKISKNLIYLVALFTIFSLINSALGQTELPIGQVTPQPELFEWDTLKDFLLSVLRVALLILTWVAGILAAIFIVWGGVNVILQGQIDEGKNRLIYGIVGLVIALLGYAIIQLIGAVVQGGQTGAGTTP